MLSLNDEQKKAAIEINGSCIVSASPGTGKTRTLVARAINKIGKLPKYKSLALITYTNAAADEINSRIVTNKTIFIGTIHSFCLEFIVRPFGWTNKWAKPMVISYEQQEQFIEKNTDITLGDSPLDELGKIKRKLDGSIDLEVVWEHHTPIEEVAERYLNYQQQINVIDFNEILFRAYKIISENSFVAKSLSNKFYEILVDEFQDTNIYQYEILKIINHSGSCTFFMVGDEKQQIFSFAGAIENAFTKAKEDFDPEPVELMRTYRSTNNIVDAYSSLFHDHPILINESSVHDMDIGLIYCETTNANHDFNLKEAIRWLIVDKDVVQDEIAVLSTSWYAAYPASKLLRQDYSLVGLGSLPHKKSINCSSFQLLKALARFSYSKTNRSLMVVRRNFELHLLEKGLELEEKVKFHKTNTLITKFDAIDLEIGIADGIILCQNLFNKVFQINHSTFDEILKLISDDEKESWSFGEYVQALSGIGGITSNTIHKAKGLEFDAVVLNQMNENRIPYQRLLDRTTWTYEELTDEMTEEGRKLFYVALSRAKKYLIIFHNWKPSMYIDIIKS